MNKMRRINGLKVLILCGGFGSRMEEMVKLIPKPMMEIGGRPLLWHLMKCYSSYGVKNFVLLVGNKKEAIMDYFSAKENVEDDWNVVFSDSGESASKAKRILDAKNHIEEHDFFVAYGDDLSDVDIAKLYDFHKDNDKMATLTAVKPKSQFGIIEIDDDATIRQFKEKPILEHWINGGFFCFKREILDHMTEGTELEKEVFEGLVEKKGIQAFKHDGFWKCMNTQKDHKEFNDLWEEHAPWKNW